MKLRPGLILPVVITLMVQGAYAKQPVSKEITQLNAQWQDYLDEVVSQLHADPDVNGPHANMFVQADAENVSNLITIMKSMSVRDPSFLPLSRMLGNELKALWFDEKYMKGWWLG